MTSDGEIALEEMAPEVVLRRCHVGLIHQKDASLNELCVMREAVLAMGQQRANMKHTDGIRQEAPLS